MESVKVGPAAVGALDVLLQVAGSALAKWGQKVAYQSLRHRQRLFRWVQSAPALHSGQKCLGNPEALGVGGPAPAVGGTTSGIALGRPPVQFDQKLPFGKVGPPLPHLGPDEVDDGLVFGLPVPQRLGSMKAPVGFPFAGHGVCGSVWHTLLTHR